MSSQNTKLLVPAQGKPFVPTSTAKPTINEPYEVLIRLKAIAINPADCKMIDQGLRVTSWPLVPGLDGAGIVEAVGDDVKNFAAGDEVLAQFTAGDRGGAYQNFAVVSQTMVAKKPKAWQWEEASSLPVCFLTAISALGVGLKVPLPFLNNGPSNNFKPASVLILGGSSALGAAAVQLLRLALPECTIMTTSSPKHHDHLKTLGVDRAFDRSSSTLVDEVLKASEEVAGSRGVDAILDTVGAGSENQLIFKSLDAKGPKRYAQVWTGEDEIEAPEYVDSVTFRGRDVASMPGGKNVMLALQTLLEDGRYKLPLLVKKVGKGLEAVEKGLELMRKGVSGEKLVVSI